MRVDFYVIKDPAPAAALGFTCRLSERAWKSGHQVVVLAPDDDVAKQIDSLLWTFRDDAFVPHTYIRDDAGASLDEPIIICTNERVASAAFGDRAELPALLINLCDVVPLCHARFARVAEVVGGDDQSKIDGRGRYRTYREQGADLHSHEV